VPQVSITDYQAKYLACELTRRFPSDSADRVMPALVDAQVDLNPHQVDAALFAFRSPFSNGAILADEVGLGKTIEAGLVISQRWAERRRRILVITPANLRKQWHQELTEKFFLRCVILEAKSYNDAIKAGHLQPFETRDVVICSYQFARSKASDVARVPWDLVVIDEAHRLRNVYKPSNVIANTLKLALGQRPKLLLTATPLQNSLLELFGLVSFVDEHTFGDLRSFREQFSHVAVKGQEPTVSTSGMAPHEQQRLLAAGLQFLPPRTKKSPLLETLRQRLRPLVHRTLRRQVTAYVPYTKRLPLVEEFSPDESEDRLYDLVSEYLQRDNLQALPSSQRSLMTLVLRKLLASSTFAIAGALSSMANRLRARLRAGPPQPPLASDLDQDYEALESTAEEWPDEEEAAPLSGEERAALERELADLDAFAALAGSIKHNAKGRTLITALRVAFAKARELGAAEKAIVFTESRRTQDYLLRVLGDSEFAEGIALFNGSNTDERSRAIYAAWLERHRGTDRVSGSRTADMRSALVDYFREDGRIMIATEAGAEGINLQFCSLVVNYDLPWNPQRIEQRIGRCHRYGQKHDVVVVNFLNRKNAADRRVFELLSEKFQLFEGVFGASDEVLGALESGVDFEKRIAGIYQNCRHPTEIKEAFDQLQLELSLEIGDAMTATRRKLLEHFDDEVREKLRVREKESAASLETFERSLMQLTRHELAGDAEFLSDTSFRLLKSTFGDDIPTGLYELPRRSGEAHMYRLNHPLAEAILARAQKRELSSAEITLDYGRHGGKISAVEPLVGRAGWMCAAQVSVEAVDQAEDHAVLVCRCDDGTMLDPEVAARMLMLPASVGDSVATPADVLAALDSALAERRRAIEIAVTERNAGFVQAESAKLDSWADDLKVGLERELKELDARIREAKRSATAAPSLELKLAAQKEVRALEAERTTKRRGIFDAQDRVDAQRDRLIESIEQRLAQTIRVAALFQLRWRLV
jgi:superfamily II DNA or RNA helicase